MLIGKSLSFCVKDIVEGKVSFNDVDKIITGTYCPDKGVFLDVIESYQQSYWKKYPLQAAIVARRLWDEQKIDQPRVRGENPPNIADRKIWIFNRTLPD